MRCRNFAIRMRCVLTTYELDFLPLRNTLLGILIIRLGRRALSIASASGFDCHGVAETGLIHTDTHTVHR